MAGEWFEWEWDESLFAGRAPHTTTEGDFRTHRALPKRSQHRSVSTVGADSWMSDAARARSRCASRRSSPRIVGLDPDVGMIGEARAARVRTVGRPMRGGSRRAPKSSPADLGRFRVVDVRGVVSLDGPAARGCRACGRCSSRAAQSCMSTTTIKTGSSPRPGSRRRPEARIDALRPRVPRRRSPRAGRSIRNTSPSATKPRCSGPRDSPAPRSWWCPTVARSSRSIDDLVDETFSMSSDRAAPLRRPARRTSKPTCAACSRTHRPAASSRNAFPTIELKIWRPPA